MNNIRLSDSDMEELRNAFIEQATEIVDSLPEHIIQFERSRDPETLKAIKRAFHTIKGDSRAMGFSGLSALAHKIEDIIKDEDIGKGTIDMLLECSDAFKSYIEIISQRGEPDVSALMKKLEAFENKPTPEEVVKTYGIERKSLGGLSFLRIEAGKIDRIMDLIGELIISRSMLNQIASDKERLDISDTYMKLESINSIFERHISDLQSSVMKMRMLPIGNVFRKFPRVIRGLSVETGKPLRLLIEGEDTEIDKGIIDSIGEPLLHLIRNAVDHGIEPIEERLKKGKPEEGTITLRAFHQGNQIVIEVSDDGAGIDIESLKVEAVRRGIISPEDSSKLSKRDALNLIYISGLSTARQVTEVSGRGVGMDIIKEAVESLRGIIEIDTEKDRGTTVSLRLPLTLAIIKAIVFRDGDGIFAIPSSSVIEILRVSEQEIEPITGVSALRHRSGLVPLCSVNNRPISEKQMVVIIGVAQKKAGILTEKIIGEESLVIKAIDGIASSGIAIGASILGDGKIVLILDPLGLINRAGRQDGSKGLSS